MSVFRPIIYMATMKYPDETMLTLYFHRNIVWSLSDTMYLKLTITTSNWTWDESGSTVKQITLSAGSSTHELIFKYGLAVPSSSTKFSIAVTLEYYSDSAYTNLVETDNHTFEGHFYHSSDFSSYVVDHVGFDGSTSSDNSILSVSINYSGYTFQNPLIEGSGCLAIGNNYTVTISGFQQSKFAILTYWTSGGKIRYNNVDQSTIFNSVRKYSVYPEKSSSSIALWAQPNLTIKVDGVYMMTPLP